MDPMADAPRWKVFWAETLPGRDDVTAALEAGGCALVPGRPFTDAGRSFSEDELIEVLREVDAVMVGSRERWTRRVFEACPRLRTVAKLGIGVERIDVRGATELGILVSNTPVPENYLSVAEHAVGAMIAFTKNFKAADRAAREGRWRGVTNTLLRGKTVGIIGVGRIGSRLAALLRPFEVRLLGYDPFVPDERLRALGVEATRLEDLLAASDFVTVHAVVTGENVGMIGEEQLRRMKPTAFFINNARGMLVQEAALSKALKEGWIAGAALDVFEPEPPSRENPLLDPAFEGRTLLSPHTAGVTHEAMWRMPLEQVKNTLSALRGDAPEWTVNPEVVPRWRDLWGIGARAAAGGEGQG
jgi:D-3-phosphoglycerate dehydrogenase